MHNVLLRERSRADRNNHEFSFIVFDIGEKKQDKIFITHLSQFLNSRLRSIDEKGWFDKNQIGIVLPYTSAINAMKVAEDLCKNFQADGSIQLSKIFTYPSVWPYKKDDSNQNINSIAEGT